MKQITQYDLSLLQQRSLHFLAKAEILDDKGKVINAVYSAIGGGNASVSSESDVRRTCSITLLPLDQNRLPLALPASGWLDKALRLSIGVMDLRTGSYLFYPQGYFLLQETASTYDAASNQLSLNCSDFMLLLDGTKNGQAGALTTLIPAYEEDPETGGVIRYNIIREAMVRILKQVPSIKSFLIDDIGEFSALSQNNDDWQEYRAAHPLWNALPHDLVFEDRYTMLDILKELRDLYPNYEMFFDTDNTFVCQMIPSCNKNEIVMNNDFLQKVLISENVTVELTAVRNICEVRGPCFETDFLAEASILTEAAYLCTIEGYGEYQNGDVIAVSVSVPNPAGAKLKINQLEEIGIYEEDPEQPLPQNLLAQPSTYCFRIKKLRIDRQTVIRAYYLGQWQPHGLDVLTDGSIGKELCLADDGRKYRKYSREYFQAFYHCRNVNLTVVRESPFCVQRIGELLDVRLGGEYENLTSDSLALARAKYENWKNSRLTDCISITTLLLPFLEVNTKVSYRRRDFAEEQPYIIKTISHDYDAFTSTVAMYRFYPLYEEIQKEAGTHKVLSHCKNGVLGKYTHARLQELTGGEL